MPRYTVQEFYSVEGDNPWCILDNEAEYVVARFATREEAEMALTRGRPHAVGCDLDLDCSCP